MSVRKRAAAGDSVSFHDEAPTASKYKSIIERAKRSKEITTPLSGTPRFDQLSAEREPTPPPGVVPKETLSDKTVQGLTAISRATQEALEEKEREEELKAETEKEPEPELSEEEQLRIAVESRLEPLDIGGYLMTGSLLQTVPIIPGKLVVKFRSVTALEEVYVDAQLAEIGESMTGRQFIRTTNEYALASHIQALNDTNWPGVFDGDKTVSKKAMDMRLNNVRQLPSPIFQMLVQQLQWFLDRISKSLTLEALGNG